MGAGRALPLEIFEYVLKFSLLIFVSLVSICFFLKFNCIDFNIGRCIGGGIT